MKFKRTVKFGPINLNFSKKGMGYSVGVKGYRVGKDSSGKKYTHYSIPGTGLYNRTYNKSSKIMQKKDSNTEINSAWFFVAFLIFIAILGFLSIFTDNWLIIIPSILVANAFYKIKTEKPTSPSNEFTNSDNEKVDYSPKPVIYLKSDINTTDINATLDIDQVYKTLRRGQQFNPSVFNSTIGNIKWVCTVRSVEGGFTSYLIEKFDLSKSDSLSKQYMFVGTDPSGKIVTHSRATNY